MRLRAIGVAGVCGLAASAGGQTLAIDISFDQTSFGIGGTAVATMTATLDGFGASAYFAVVVADLRMVCAGSLVPRPYNASASPATGLDWANPALGEVSGGTPEGGDLLGMFGAQSTFLPPADNSNPFVIAQWVIIGTAEGLIEYTVEAAQSAPGAFGVVDPTTNPFAAPIYYNIGDSDFLFTSGRTGVLGSEVDPCIPAPGTTGLAVICVGVLGRRRR